MQIGQYQLRQKLGEGDMGTVFVAQSIQTSEQVAIKVLNKIDVQSAMDRGAAAEILDFAASIQHPILHPILEVIDTDIDGGMLAVVMPLAAASIGDFFAQGKPIPPKHHLRIIDTVIEGLQFLHDQEVAHGSLKPTNILVDRGGNPTITDLAMAHIRDFGLVPRQATLLQEHYIFTDRLFNSTPELAADIFALATFIYQLLTGGRLPFSDPRSEVRKVEQPSAEGLSPLVHSVLLRGLTHRKELAYPDLAAFAADFHSALQGKIDPETKRWFSVDTNTSSLDEEE